MLHKHGDHPVWKRISFYIAQLCLNIFLLTSVEKIVIGGGISNHQGLLKDVEVEFDRLLNNYIQVEGKGAEKHPIIVSAMKDKMNELFGAVLSLENE